MASEGTSLLGALVGHSTRLLTRRHDGTGLPDKHTSLIWVLIALLGVIEVVRNLCGLAAANDSAPFSLLYAGWWVVIYLFVVRPMKVYRLFYVMLLLALAGNVLTLAMSLPLGGPPHPSIKLLLALWQAYAIHPFVKQVHRNPKNSNEKE